MHAIQTLFSQGQLLFTQRNFSEAYAAFAQCTQIMPSLNAAWENMAVCLANQGHSKVEITNKLLKMAPKDTHSAIVSKVKTLLIPQDSEAPLSDAFMQLLQQEKLQDAVAAFDRAWRNQDIDDDVSVQFLRGLFIAHEHTAKKQGQLYLPRLLNTWKDHPAIKHCMDVTSARMHALIVRHQTEESKATLDEIELLETLGLVHYTYTNYDNAAFIFKTLCSLSPDIQKLDEYRKHLSTCYSLNAQYKEALEMDTDNCTAWERFDATNPKAFRAQALKNHRSAERIQRTALSYWPSGYTVHQSEELTIASLHKVFVCGHDPMVFDTDFVYAGNRGTFRFAPPNPETPIKKDSGIVVFATNPNNYYHLLIEFSAKLLAADTRLPADVPVYIPTSNRSLVQSMLTLLGINRSIETFSVFDTLAFHHLYIVDVTRPGHFSDQPANVWDCYLTHGDSLKRMATAFCKECTTHGSKHTFIYAKRSGGARSFIDPEARIEQLIEAWAQDHNLELVVFEGQMGLREQIELFQSCKVLFGLHGAGFTNLLFTPEDCTMVEIPIHGNCNPLFQELSALMQRSHLVCDVSCEYQGTLEVTPSVVTSIQNTLDQSL